MGWHVRMSNGLHGELSSGWARSLMIATLIAFPLHGVGIRGFSPTDTPGSNPNDPFLEDSKKIEQIQHHEHTNEGDHDHIPPTKPTLLKNTSAKKPTPLGEQSSFFAGFNYQASGLGNMVRYANSTGIHTPTMGFPPLMGVGVQVGYKHFFGKKHTFGLRYFGFFDYNHSRFGVITSKEQPFSFGPYSFRETDSYAGAYAANLYTYGAGLDMLYNFFSNKYFIVGLALGFQLAGDSWATSIQTEIQNYTKTHKDSSYSPANFQFLVNFAFRAQFAKRNGIELGIKIPTITHRYFSITNANGDSLQASVRRLYAFQISYLRDF